jgi:hypothetical protein
VSLFYTVKSIRTTPNVMHDSGNEWIPFNDSYSLSRLFLLLAVLVEEVLE